MARASICSTDFACCPEHLAVNCAAHCIAMPVQVREALQRGMQRGLNLLGNRWALVPDVTLAAYRFVVTMSSHCVSAPVRQHRCTFKCDCC